MLYLGTSWLVAVMEQTVLRDERTDYEWDRHLQRLSGIKT